ncbi:MAG: hypothetical protein Q9215_004908 [Flavoplaca cf. flavocitrina]
MLAWHSAKVDVRRRAAIPRQPHFASTSTAMRNAVGSSLVSAGPDRCRNYTAYIIITTHLRRRLTKLNPTKSTPMTDFVTSERLIGTTWTEQGLSHDTSRPVPSLDSAWLRSRTPHAELRTEASDRHPMYRIASGPAAAWEGQSQVHVT